MPTELPESRGEEEPTPAPIAPAAQASPGTAESPKPPADSAQAQPPGHLTLRGIRTLRTATWVVIGSNAIAVVASIAAWYAFVQLQTSLESGRSSLAQQAVATLLLSEGLALVSLLVAVGGALVGLVGARSMGMGRTEFGSSHARSVGVALPAVGIASLAYVYEGFALLTWGSSMAGSLEGVSDFESYKRALLSGLRFTFTLSVVDFAAAVLSAAAMAWLIQALVTRSSRRHWRRFLGFGLSGPVLVVVIGWAVVVAVSGISFYPSGSWFRSPYSDLSRLVGAVKPLFSVSALAGVLTIVALIEYNRLLDLAERGAKKMMHTGVFDPDYPEDGRRSAE